MRMQNLKRWFLNVAGQYEKWARYEVRWKQKRNASIKGIEFPFCLPGRTEEPCGIGSPDDPKEEETLHQAPTGVGKTMATCFRR